MGVPEYYVHLSYEAKPRPWDLDDESQDFGPMYVRKVLRAMEDRLERRDLTFYITWKLDELPSYGRNVVAVVMGDEWSRIPAYADKVLATFKCYGTRPSLGCNPLRNPSYLNLMLTLKMARTLAHHVPGSTRYAWQRARRMFSRGAPSPPLFDFPLGYGNQLDLPVKNIAERGTDLFFAGSVSHDTYPVWSPKYWIQNPKSISRQQMMEGIARLQKKNPELNVELATTSSFALNAIYYGTADTTEVLDTRRYSERMMDTKICLIPRGTSPETFRFFEGLRYGCVLITEKLPSRWFYSGSPSVEIGDWRELDGLVESLLKDSGLMQQKHMDALQWWEAVCSERAVGAYMAEELNRILL